MVTRKFIIELIYHYAEKLRYSDLTYLHKLDVISRILVDDEFEFLDLQSDLRKKIALLITGGILLQDFKDSICKELIKDYSGLIDEIIEEEWDKLINTGYIKLIDMELERKLFNKDIIEEINLTRGINHYATKEY